MRARRAQSAIASAWLIAFCASLLFVLAIVLDWVNLRPAGYQLTGSSVPSSKKTASEPHDSTVGH
jgi:hypothetical protein